MDSQQYYSPLRYPGGKASLKDFLVKFIDANSLQDGLYIEPFAGGAGVALELLIQEYVSKIIINDKDPFIYFFWRSVIDYNDEIIKLIHDTKVTIEEWEWRKKILQSKDIQDNLSLVELGFTAFFLNRCNRSGILKANPIGGRRQTGKWKIDARYNKKELINRIYKIGFYNKRIRAYNQNAIDFLNKNIVSSNKKTTALLYLDPPYVVNGHQLYRFSFKERDHRELSKFLQNQTELKWIISYDDDILIHEIYKEVKKTIFEFNYFANSTKIGKELIITSNNCKLPISYIQYSRQKDLSMIGDTLKQAI